MPCRSTRHLATPCSTSSPRCNSLLVEQRASPRIETKGASRNSGAPFEVNGHDETMRITGTDDFRVLHVDPTGPLISNSDDVSDLFGNAWVENIALIALPHERLDPEFFRLGSLLAGDVLQKIVNYRLQLAIIGDISEYTEQSQALRDFVWESNRGEHAWFLPDEAALEAKLKR